MPDPILLTGAAGFIGSHLAKRLVASNERVVGIDNFDAFYARAAKEANLVGLSAPAFELVEADICDAQAMDDVFRRYRPRLVIHAAALAGVRPSIRDPRRYVAVNIDGLVNVLEAARTSSSPRVVFVSSSSVYGNRSSVPFAEDDPVDHPVSPYAATKRAGELIALPYAELFGLAIVSVRLFTVFGPAQRPDLAISKFMRQIAAGEPVPMFGDGTTSRDYTYVDDIVDGILAAADRAGAADDGFHRIYNLGGSDPVTLADMIEHIGHVVGRPPVIDQLPMQPGDVDRTYADLTRSRTELGFTPKVSFTEGLERQWSWMRTRDVPPPTP